MSKINIFCTKGPGDSLKFWDLDQKLPPSHISPSISYHSGSVEFLAPFNVILKWNSSKQITLQYDCLTLRRLVLKVTFFTFFSLNA